MRTTINIQDGIIDDIVRYYHSKTKTEAVNRALSEWVNIMKKNSLLSLRGQVDFEDNLDKIKQKEIEDLNKL